MSKCTGAPWIDTQKGVTGKTKLPFLAPVNMIRKATNRAMMSWRAQLLESSVLSSTPDMHWTAGYICIFSFTSQLRRICIAALFNQKSAWLNWRTSLKYRDKRKNHQLKVNNLVNGVSCFLPDELVFQLAHTFIFVSYPLGWVVHLCVRQSS